MMRIVNKQDKEKTTSLISQAMEKNASFNHAESRTDSTSSKHREYHSKPANENVSEINQESIIAPHVRFAKVQKNQENSPTQGLPDTLEKPKAYHLKKNEAQSIDAPKMKSIQDVAAAQSKLKANPEYQQIKEKNQPNEVIEEIKEATQSFLQDQETQPYLNDQVNKEKIQANADDLGSEKTVSYQPQKKDSENKSIQPHITAVTQLHPTTQLLLSSKVLIHRPEAGLNPIVDAAAHLFSVMGKLRHLKTHDNLEKLQRELIEDIENFLITIQSYHYDEQYLGEYVLITRYALCVTLDDIIYSTPWGGLGKWDGYSLIKSFEQEPLSHQNFLIILERLIRDPEIYIDLMEFIYICLSLGFKCRYNSSEFDHQQLEHINDALYKRIRSYRGNFSKILSPYSLRTAKQAAPPVVKKKSPWPIIFFAIITIAALFFGGKYALDNMFNHVNQSLAQTELVTYAKNTQSV